MRSTGSVAPSSRYLCKAIVEKIDPSKARFVVELGPGDGVVTQFILDRLPEDARLFVFEINARFVEQLKERFDDPRLVIIHDSAELMGAYFEQHGIQAVDYVISGIPFVMLPESLAESIMAVCKQWLRPGGVFIQFHYSPWLLSFYKKIFGNVETDVVPLNIPPAIVVRCTKL
jgi:phospholipid N-methyltransferase